MPSFSFSQPVQKYIHYDINDGLSANTVYTAIQDSRGFMWFSTSKGVTRFDGYQFVRYAPIAEVAQVEILKIFFEENNRMWLIPYGNGAYCIQGDSAASIEPPALDSLFVNSVAFSGDTVWFGSHNDGITGFDFSRQSEIAIDKKRLGSRSGSVAVDRHGALRIGTEKGVCAWTNGSLYCLQLPDSFFSKGYEVSLKFMADGRLIAYTKSHILEVASDTFVTVFACNQIDPQLRIHFVNGNVSGELLVATNKGGVKLEYKNGRYLPVTYLPEEHVNMFYEDSEGNYWFTTAHHGVYFLGRLMRHIFTLEEADGIPLGNVHFLKSLKAIPDKFFAGNSEGYLFMLDDKSTAAVELSTEQQNLMVYDVAESNDIFYVATSHGLFITRHEDLFKGNESFRYPPAGAINQYSGDSVRTYPIASDFNYIQWNSPRTLEVDSSGNLWFGANTGITKVVQEPNRNSFTRYNNERTFKIKIDPSGRLFALTLSGLGVLKENGQMDYALPVNNVGNAKISHFDFDADNNLWVATLGQGLFAFGNDSVYRYTEDDVLLLNRINHFQISKGHIYICYSREVDRFHLTPTFIASDSRKRFDMNSLLGSDEINKMYHQEGNIYLATNTGIMMLNEHEDVAIERPPMLNILNMEIGSETFKSPGRFEVLYRNARFKVEYTGISFSSFRNITFRYMLEGIDEAWTETRERTVEYPQLPAGSYAFLLSAKSTGSEWVAPVRIQLAVLPPFWKKTWFILLAITLFIGITAAVARWRVSSVRKRARERIALNKRIAEYKMKALQAQMNPHFISNALASIQRYVSISDAEKASVYLGKFSKLMRYVMESSINDKITLDEEIKLLSLYLELEMLRFGGKAKYNIYCSPDVIPEEIELPTMLLQPFVENAVIHGITPKGNGTVSVVFMKREKNLICVVTDEGKGGAESPGRSRAGKFPSRSTELINQRLETIRQTENMDIKISISNLSASEGCSVEVIVPLA